MRKRTLVVVVALVAIAILATLAAACGSSSTSSTATPAASGTGSSVATVTADASLNALLPANIKSAGQIKVASDIPYMPWEGFVGTTTQVTGYDYDLGQAIAARLGVKAVFAQTPFDSAILAIKGGKDDMIMSDMYDNATRQAEGVSFVDYAYDTTAILVQKGNPQGITTAESLAGKTVGCESGTTQQAFLQQLNKQLAAAGKSQITIKAFPNQPAALLQVKSGGVVGDVTDRSTAEYNAQTTNNGNTFEVVTDPAAPNGYFPTLVGAAIASTNTQLITAVQKSLQSLIDDGTYAQISKKWNIVQVNSAQVNAGASPSPSTTP